MNQRITAIGVATMAAAVAAAGLATTAMATTGQATASPARTDIVGSAGSPTDETRYPCRGYGAMDVSNPLTQVMADRFRWGAWPAAKVGNGSGNIAWGANPYRQPSWFTWFHSLQWIGAIVKKATEGYTAQRDPSVLLRAETIAADWVRDNRYPWPTGPGAGNATMTRANTMLCLRAAIIRTRGSAPAWLDASLIQHANWLNKVYASWTDHNVGTDQTIAMMGIGCTLARQDFVTLAVARLRASISRVIDAQGANNEQSVGYADWNSRLWDKANNTLRSCGLEAPGAVGFTARRDGLGAFLDAATAPDGTQARLGDTTTTRLEATRSAAQAWVASNGASGSPPATRVAVYAAGYVFGRSSWGGPGNVRNQSFYTLRFGPARAAHGHNDHTALTWQAKGRDILVDPGVGQYVNDAWRAHYLSAAAHNQSTTPAMKVSPVTVLRRQRIGSTAAVGDYFELADTPAKGLSRNRGVLVLSDPEVVVVRDTLTSAAPTSFTQRWHLAPDQVLTVHGTTARAARPGDRNTTWLAQLPSAGGKATKFTATRGQTKGAIQGWYWTTPFRRHPAPVASTTRVGRSAGIVTAIVAAPAGANVTVSAAIRGRSTTYTFRVGTRTVRVALDAGGTLTRVG